MGTQSLLGRGSCGVTERDCPDAGYESSRRPHRKVCSYKAETRVVPGGLLAGGIITIYPHTKQCALMPDCQKSGIFTYDQKFLPFDGAGNQKALAYFKQAEQEDDFRVEVIGQIQSDVLKVASIKPLP